jgi:YidC/Oxa1 family membrane protein insertase
MPLILQIPFFIALFSLLRSTTFKDDIASNPGFLFIDNLAVKATGATLIVLIVLYVGTQLIASLITAISADPTQRRIMLALPFVFVLFIINFPAGLIVYWITTNVWTIGQQLLVKKLYPKPEPINRDDDDGGATPAARGKPPSPKPATAAAVTDGSSSKASKLRAPRQKESSGGGNGGPAKAPPPSPRKKKKRSGRRR